MGETVAPISQPTLADAVTAADFPIEECSVCFEPMGGACPLRRLACGHGYHHACIQRWLQRNATCPLCKMVAPADECDCHDAKPRHAFHIDMGHPEMGQFIHELEDIL